MSKEAKLIATAILIHAIITMPVGASWWRIAIIIGAAMILGVSGSTSAEHKSNDSRRGLSMRS